jgi:hypothetical protein
VYHQILYTYGFTWDARAFRPALQHQHRHLAILSQSYSVYLATEYLSRKQHIPTRHSKVLPLRHKHYGITNSLSRARPQTPIPTSHPLVLSTQCQHQRKFQLQPQLTLTLDLTAFATTPCKNTIFSSQRRHAREEERPRRLQDTQNNADGSLSVSKHCSRRRRTDSQTVLKHRQLSRTRAVLWTSQDRRLLRAMLSRSTVLSTASIPDCHFGAWLKLVAKLFWSHASPVFFSLTDREQARVRRRCRGRRGCIL